LLIPGHLKILNTAPDVTEQSHSDPWRLPESFSAARYRPSASRVRFSNHQRHNRKRETGLAADMAAPSEPPEESALLALPRDLLVCVFAEQAALGPRELCRLEQTSKIISALLADEGCWQRLFLRERRCPVLGPPTSWKAEYARRHEWSRTWRQRGFTDAVASHSDAGSHISIMPAASAAAAAATAASTLTRCIAPAVSACPSRKKLRKLALMMLPGSLGLAAALGSDSIHVVDPRTPGCFVSIAAAIACARPHETVLVAAGVYHERLEIDKSIDLVGVGDIGEVHIIGTDGPVIQVSSSRVACRVAKMRIEQRAASEGVPMSGAVRVEGGAVLALEECTISSSSGHCVVVKGADSCGYILHNQVHKAKGVGVLVCDHARGVIEDNDIAANARAGVAILSGGNPVVRNNRIHDGRDSGVLVSEKGRGRIEGNDIFANMRAGVAILREGAPLVARNRIHNGFDSGVLVCELGMGSVIDNEIYSNHMAGVAIGHGGASTVKGNTIRDGSGGSLLCLSTQSKGLICANVIDQDPGATLQVPEGLLPEVQEQNLIRFIGQVHLSC
jgi:nitrous oxidase accessory protein NosD